MSSSTETTQVPLQPVETQPPDGVSSTAWCLHQAARAMEVDRPGEALQWIERANAADSPLVNAAVPELRQLASAEALARVARFAESQPDCEAGLLVGAAASLECEPEGRALLEAALRDDLPAARQLLVQLADRPDLPSAAAHHLALLYLRAALHAEENDLPGMDELWRCSWQCWLRWSTQASSEDRALVFGWLLGQHRTRIRDLLARNAIEAARRPWQRVVDLSGKSQDLSGHVVRFRDDLVTETVAAAREAMRYGVAAGWDNDYEAGLTCLTRLLSLERDNLRLLTELIVIGAEWLQECYANSNSEELARLVDRFTPFGLQLARLVDRGEGAELTTRAALAEFTKFRGFVAGDPARKAELYLEALRYDPSCDEIRQLPAETESTEERQI